MMGPEQKRLIDRLCHDPNRRLLNFHVARGEVPCTAEELCAEINSALDQVENGTAIKGLPESGRPRRTVDELLAEIDGRTQS